MIHQRQTRGTNCGQTCMAMLLQWSVDLVETRMHCKGKTSYTKLRTFLKEHSRFTLGRTTKMWTEEFPLGKLLVRWTFSPQKSHWVLFENAGDSCWVYDPLCPHMLRLGEWFKVVPKGRVTSYARVS